MCSTARRTSSGCFNRRRENLHRSAHFVQRTAGVTCGSRRRVRPAAPDPTGRGSLRSDRRRSLPATRPRPLSGGSAGGNGRRSRRRRSSARVPVRCRGTLYGEAVPAAAVTDDAGRELAELLAELVAFPTESTHAEPRSDSLVRRSCRGQRRSGDRVERRRGPGQSAGFVRTADRRRIDAVGPHRRGAGRNRLGDRPVLDDEGRRRVARSRHGRHEGLHRRDRFAPSRSSAASSCGARCTSRCRSTKRSAASACATRWR